MSGKRKRGKRMGRPPVKASERRSEIVAVRLTKAERRQMDAEARKLGITISELLLRRWKGEADGRR